MRNPEKDPQKRKVMNFLTKVQESRALGPFWFSGVVTRTEGMKGCVKTQIRQRRLFHCNMIIDPTFGPFGKKREPGKSPPSLFTL